MRLLDSCQKPFNSAWKLIQFRLLLSGLVQLVADSRAAAPGSTGSWPNYNKSKLWYQLHIKSIKWLVSSIKLLHIKRCEWLIYFIVLLLFEHFQMIQAIQVLRFHLLELEKVTFSHHLCPTRPYKPTRAAFAEMHFCSSLVISVKINHGAIFSSAFNHDASCYKWNGRRRAPCPSVSAPFNDILCRQKLHARWNMHANSVGFRDNS